MGTLLPPGSCALSPGWSSPEHSWRRYGVYLSPESYRTAMSPLILAVVYLRVKLNVFEEFNGNEK